MFSDEDLALEVGDRAGLRRRQVAASPIAKTFGRGCLQRVLVGGHEAQRVAEARASDRRTRAAVERHHDSEVEVDLRPS